MVFTPPDSTPPFTLDDSFSLVTTDDYKKVDRIVLEHMLVPDSFVAFDIEYDSAFPVCVHVDGAALHTTTTRIATIQLATPNRVLVVLVQNNGSCFTTFICVQPTPLQIVPRLCDSSSSRRWCINTDLGLLAIFIY